MDVASFLAAARQAYPLLRPCVAGRPVALAPVRMAARGGAGRAGPGLDRHSTIRSPACTALGPSRDRIGNVGLAQVVAAGTLPLHTTQVGQLHFEPFWGCWWRRPRLGPERLLRCTLFSLVMALGFPSPSTQASRPAERDGDAWSGWERARGGLRRPAQLLRSTSRASSACRGRAASSRSPTTPSASCCSRCSCTCSPGSDLEGRPACGLFLQLIGWAFVLHMVCPAVACAFAALFVARAAGRSPHRTRLTSGRSSASTCSSSARTWCFCSWDTSFLARLPPTTPCPPRLRTCLEPTIQTGVLFWLGARGASWPGAEATGCGGVGHPALGLAGAVGRLPRARRDTPRARARRDLLLAPFPHRRERGHRRSGTWPAAWPRGRPVAPRAGGPGGGHRAAGSPVLDPLLVGSRANGTRTSPDPRPAVARALRDAMEFLRRETDPARWWPASRILTRYAASAGARRAGGREHERAAGRAAPLAGAGAGDLSRRAAVRAALAPYGVDYLLVDRALSPGTPR